MGWFLTRKSKSTGRKASKTKRSSVKRKPWDPQRTLAGLKLLGVFVLSIAMVAGWWRVQNALVSYVGRSQASTISPQEVEMVNIPSWMNPQVHQDLQILAANQISASPLNVNSLQSAYLALSQNAWVQEVNQIQRVSADHVRIVATYRQPAAFIEQGDNCYLIDTKGIRLPGIYQTQQASQLPLTVLRGVGSRPCLQGQPWQGQDVQAGLSLIAELSVEPYRQQVEAIDVSGRDSRGRIHLAILTGQGGIVRWGLPPGHEQSIEPSAATKRSWLTQLVRENGQIDAGGKMVDLYRAALFVHLPPGREIGQKDGYTLYQ